MVARPAVTPINSVGAVVPMNAVADTAEELGFRFEQLNLAQLNKGQLYQGRIAAHLGKQSFLVALNGAALKMTLDTSSKVGDAILLRYLGSFPTPTFLLLPQLSPDSQARISDTARLISQYINTPNGKQAALRFEAATPVTSAPSNPTGRITADLQRALVMSGLFYESHLTELILGRRTLSLIMQEPQNQTATRLTMLVPQQLQILEQQRLLWHGEIWPGQRMEWEITRQQEEKQSETSAPNGRCIDSSVTLHLPRLGPVTARLRYSAGQLHVELQARDADTRSLLKQESSRLTERLQATGQTLSRLTVDAHDSTPQT